LLVYFIWNISILVHIIFIKEILENFHFTCGTTQILNWAIQTSDFASLENKIVYKKIGGLVLKVQASRVRAQRFKLLLGHVYVSPNKTPVMVGHMMLTPQCSKNLFYDRTKTDFMETLNLWSCSS
jgi:hypothetical protein